MIDPRPAGSRPSRAARSRLRWSIGGLLAAVGLLSACGADGPVDPVDPVEEISCDPTGSATVDGEVIPAAPHGYVTAGNQIFSLDTCEPHRFLGVSRPTLSFSPDGGRLAVDSAAAADFRRIGEWKANTVRIELAQHFWLSTSRFYDPGYAARVHRVVELARDAGLDVILALQHSDRGNPGYPGDYRSTNMHQPMPDVNHSVPFWREIAQRYKGDGRVLFEIYSEPYPGTAENRFSDWDLWLNGGTVPADRVYEDPRAAYQAVGMQDLYQVVRDAGANNLVLVSGTAWGYFLDGLPEHLVEGHNIAYTTHLWDWESKQPASWQKDWAFLAARAPVMITEFGSYDCTTRYVDAALDTADRLGLSWVAWAWEAPIAGAHWQGGEGDPVCAFPMLITDWEGTPSRTGQAVKDRLAGY
jgi:endoglucanase